VLLEGAVMDLYIGSIGKNSSALEVACGPPEIRAKFEIIHGKQRDLHMQWRYS
jgi:hypothetical protein